MRRYNQRVYRMARAIVKNEAEAEDVMQQAYINAFTHLHQFEQRSKFSTWLIRIAVREALLRRRKARPTEPMTTDAEGELMPHTLAGVPDPERQAYGAELRELLEDCIDALPESYRIVFMCRDVEGLSTIETAEALELGEEAVKTRLHRARAMLRRELYARAGGSTVDAYTFYLTRCDAIVQRVFAVLAQYR